MITRTDSATAGPMLASAAVSNPEMKKMNASSSTSPTAQSFTFFTLNEPSFDLRCRLRRGVLSI